jgi:hypothetical protein
MAAAHVIVWDLDDTLGNFEALRQGGESEDAITVGVRPGLAEALAALRAAGFCHALLTMATPLYAELALAGTGLREHFDRVDGLGARRKGDAVGIAECFGIPARDRAHRMVFVGDDPRHDQPRDPEVVFHLEPSALLRSAQCVQQLLVHLRERGGGSMARGFARLGHGGWRSALWRLGRGLPIDHPIERDVPGAGRVLLMRRREAAPVIAFSDPPAPAVVAASATFVPAALLGLARSRLAERHSPRPLC